MLDAGDPGFSYLWSTAETTQVISVNTAITYSVNVIDSVSGCTSFDEIVVSISDIPVAGFNATPISLTVNFNNTSVDATTYSWDFGDGSGTSIAMDPSYVYASSGTYTVILIVTGPCGARYYSDGYNSRQCRNQ